MNTRKLYIDDLRPCPTGWDLARTFHRAIVMLEDVDYDTISVDHDLGCFYGNTEMTGTHIIGYLIRRRVLGLYTPPNILVHSANPVGAKRMRDDINSHLSGPI